MRRFIHFAAYPATRVAWWKQFKKKAWKLSNQSQKNVKLDDCTRSKIFFSEWFDERRSSWSLEWKVNLMENSYRHIRWDGKLKSLSMSIPTAWVRRTCLESCINCFAVQIQCVQHSPAISRQSHPRPGSSTRRNYRQAVRLLHDFLRALFRSLLQ